jgi:folate-binding protein YgfZ
MTPELERALRSKGAVFQPFLGALLPAHFGDPGREWRAACEGAVVFAAGFRALIAAGGGDRVSFLQGMLSNDVRALAPGDGMHALQLDASAKVISDMRVYAETERFLLDVLRSRTEPVCSNLDRYLVADDVEIAVLEEEVPLIGFGGPLALASASETLGAPLRLSRPLAHVPCEFAGQRILVAAASEWGGPGLLACGSPVVGAALFEAAVETGALPLGMEALNTLRVEAGVPWAGVDMDENVLAMEAGLEAAISSTKGCYLGQETVERVSARGHVNRKLTGLVLAGDSVPPPGAKLRADGREAGHLTSALRSRRLDRVIALGYVQRRHLAVGTELEVVDGEPGLRATVVSLPFSAG